MSTIAPWSRPAAASALALGRPHVTLQNPCQYRDVRARQLRPWVEALSLALAPGESTFVIRFVSDREMRQLNRVYREKDKTTDVLSFPGSVSEEGRHLGDVVISVPVARRQAAEAEHGIDRELRVLILHGLLHCLGHDHETDDGEMDELEEALRREWLSEV
jgi:probable rRNA maturation factor